MIEYKPVAISESPRVVGLLELFKVIVILVSMYYVSTCFGECEFLLKNYLFYVVPGIISFVLCEKMKPSYMDYPIMLVAKIIVALFFDLILPIGLFTIIVTILHTIF
jgi:hypothetical protein